MCRRLSRFNLVLAIGLVACATSPDLHATQTRTIEIQTLTAAAWTPTPAPTTTPVPAPTITPTPAPPPVLISGSWVAYSASAQLRFYAPPSLIDDKKMDKEEYHLPSLSNTRGFEDLIIDIPKIQGGESVDAWNANLADFINRSKGAGTMYNQNAPWQDVVVIDGPSPKTVSGFPGHMGAFRYTQGPTSVPASYPFPTSAISATDGVSIVGMLWVGEVSSRPNSLVVIVYRADPARATLLPTEFEQVLATMDFNPK